MEVLEPNYDEHSAIAPNWDVWLTFDNCPRIVERGIDFTADVSTIKRQIWKEVADRGLNATVKVLHGERLLFQVFSLDGSFPRLPETQDARKKYPWDEWFNGDIYVLTAGEDFTMSLMSMRAYIYKMATQHAVKVSINLNHELGRLAFHRIEEDNAIH